MTELQKSEAAWYKQGVCKEISRGVTVCKGHVIGITLDSAAECNEGNGTTVNRVCVLWADGSTSAPEVSRLKVAKNSDDAWASFCRQGLATKSQHGQCLDTVFG